MTQEQLASEMVAHALSPSILAAVGFCVALYVWMSWASVRLLLRLPDFEHKSEMLSGARWSWVALVAVIAVGYAVAIAGITLTPYPISSSVTARALVVLGLFGLTMGFRHQGNGAFLSLTALGLRLRGRSVDADALLEGPRRWERKRALRVSITILLALSLVLMHGYTILGITYPLDCELASSAAADYRANEIASRLTASLDSPNIDQISAYGPIPSSDSPEFVGARMVVWSIRHILRIESPSANSLDRAQTHELFVQVSSATSREEAEEILREVHQILSRSKEAHAWNISVYNADTRLSVTGAYPGD